VSALIDSLTDQIISKINDSSYDKKLLIYLQKLQHRIQIENISPKKRSLG